jgi:hypothetical protein
MVVFREKSHALCYCMTADPVNLGVVRKSEKLEIRNQKSVGRISAIGSEVWGARGQSTAPIRIKLRR